LHILADIDLNGHINSNNANGYGAQGFVTIQNQGLNLNGYICDEGWDINDAHVVCRMLGFPEALDATVQSQYGESYSNPVFSNVQCNGSENSIFDCPADSNPSCDKSRNAGVRCLGSFVAKCYYIIITSDIISVM